MISERDKKSSVIELILMLKFDNKDKRLRLR